MSKTIFFYLRRWIKYISTSSFYFNKLNFLKYKNSYFSKYFTDLCIQFCKWIRILFIYSFLRRNMKEDASVATCVLYGRCSMAVRYI
jgi:hypothetical protein